MLGKHVWEKSHRGFESLSLRQMSRIFILSTVALAIVVAVVILYRTPGAEQTAQFGDVSLRIEIATSSIDRERGLSGRSSIPDDYGLLFVFEEPNIYGFWMKDMQFPIDIFWLDTDYEVISMALSVATSTFPNVFYPVDPALYVLETRAGFGAAHSIATGTQLRLKNF
jgi:uncharacterized protein